MSQDRRREDEQQEKAPQQTQQSEQVEQTTQKRVTETQGKPAGDQQDSDSSTEPQTGRRPDFIGEQDDDDSTSSGDSDG